MSTTDEYRQFANDCIVWARIATSGDQRKQFLELAKKWMSEAESIDRGTELQPNEAVKASEMAGEEIDRLGDPLATDEERQLRIATDLATADGASKLARQARSIIGDRLDILVANAGVSKAGTIEENDLYRTRGRLPRARSDAEPS